MKHFRRLSIIFTLMVLSSAICRAGDSIHVQNIHGMFDAKTLTVTNYNKVGVTDFVTYTITGGKNTKFWVYGEVICICLPDNGDFVTTTKITNLKRVQTLYEPADKDYLNGAYPTMQILFSKDSVDWSDLASIATHSKASADVTLPSAGDYFVRVKNAGSSKPIYIRVMEYATQHCNCFRYQP